jgi:hypothetical protein
MEALRDDIRFSFFKVVMLDQLIKQIHRTSIVFDCQSYFLA